MTRVHLTCEGAYEAGYQAGYYIWSGAAADSPDPNWSRELIAAWWQGCDEAMSDGASDYDHMLPEED